MRTFTVPTGKAVYVAPALGLLSLAFFTGTSSAQARSDISAGDLLRACDVIESHPQHVHGSTIDVPDKAEAGFCLGYLAGLLGATLYTNADDSRVLGICTPERLNPHDLAHVTSLFVRDTPRYAEERATQVVLSAAAQAYPCKNP